MVKCLNCEEDFAKYMTQQVNADTFPTLKSKAEKFGYTDFRVCEECYDELSEQLTTDGSDGVYLHPYFRNSPSDVKE